MDTAIKRWVAPFGDPRINGRSPLPSAFRSVPRPSSPLGAKAFTRCPYRAAPAPNPKHARRAQVARRAVAQRRVQRSDVRADSDKKPERPNLRLISALCALILGTVRKRQPLPTLAHRQAHTHAQARPHPTRDAGNDGRTCFTVTTCFTISREQRTEDRRTDQTSPPPASPSQLAVPDARQTRAETFCSLPSVLCHLNLVGLGRFERPTSRLSGVRSNQLSYRPKIRDQRTDDRGQTRRSGALAPSLEPVCSLISVLCPLTWKGCVDGGPGRLSQTTDDQTTDARQAMSVL